jgi:hypothetical protein
MGTLHNETRILMIISLCSLYLNAQIEEKERDLLHLR